MQNRFPLTRYAVSREMVPLSRINISDEQLEWAKKLMKKVEKEGMPPIQADGMPDAYYAKEWIELRKEPGYNRQC